MQVFAERADFECLCQLVQDKRLPLKLLHSLPQPTKILKKTLHDEALLIQEGRLFWLTCGDELQKVTPNWTAMQKRVVKAGRKSELLLQALKIESHMHVLDGTAGFGHDTLLLASTGAKVMAFERHPVMALLLFFEYERMHALPQWQKLLSLVNIVYGDFLTYDFSTTFQRVYLDPMFPKTSYHAKVGKQMQTLHKFVPPASNRELAALMSRAKRLLDDGGKLVIKRPVSADPVADGGVFFGNEVLRFERYE